jgi:hypothetical protein
MKISTTPNSSHQWSRVPGLTGLLCVLASMGTAYASAPVMTCKGLGTVVIPNVQIISTTANPASSDLPAHCNVVGVINQRVSTQDPDHFTYGIAFEVNLPDAWVGNFEMMGGGGTDGSLANPTGFFGTELAQGWAVADNDGGHQNPVTAFPPYTPPAGIDWQDADDNAGGAAHFGVDEQAREDYGFNGILQATLTAKRLIRYYYGYPPPHSYICGCSNGGRDAMMAVQRYPNLFDGVVAANPGFNLPQAAIAEAWNSQILARLAISKDANGQPDLRTTFTNGDLQVASAAILSACDNLDGLVDGIVDNFPACTDERVYPTVSRYTCGVLDIPHGGTCLTTAQVAALKQIFAGPRNSRGKELYTRWYWDAGIWDPPTGGVALGWEAWNVAFLGNPAYNTAANLTLGAGALPMIFTTPPVVGPVNGPESQEAFVFRYDFDADAPKIFATAPGYPMSAMQFMAATATNLDAFARRGGKMLVYSSVNDGIFSGTAIVNWYESVTADNHKAANFVRLFMVPNMAHCSGGPATTDLAASVLAAITQWVEQGVAPSRIVARNTDKVSPFPSGGLFDPDVAKNFPTGGTRPLCPYPLQSRYAGAGSTADATNFACVAPAKTH